jgi:hypothetical protein
MKKYICNICGKDFNMWDEQEKFSIHKHIGYGSKYDGDHIELDMCCDCFDSLIDYILPKCSISPIVEGYNG